MIEIACQCGQNAVWKAVAQNESGEVEESRRQKAMHGTVKRIYFSLTVVGNHCRNGMGHFIWEEIIIAMWPEP